ncbi:MAG: hypothetical protein QGG40_20450, partial [Myxococcota bacterium]|nr:hypothetical protein [Myxococcota bacterium]
VWWESTLSVSRVGGHRFACTPAPSGTELGRSIGRWLMEVGPHVAIQVGLGALWNPREVGAHLTLASLGAGPEEARTRVLGAARDLTTWLDLYDDVHGWIPAPATRDVGWHAQPLRLARLRVKDDLGTESSRSDGATHRFLDLASRQGTGLLLTVRADGSTTEQDLRIEQIEERLEQDRSRACSLDELRRYRFIRSRFDRLLGATQPFQVSSALVGWYPLTAMDRVTGRQAVEEWGVSRCHLGRPVLLSPDVGVHGTFDALGGSQPAVAKLAFRLLCLVPGISSVDDVTEECELPHPLVAHTG